MRDGRLHCAPLMSVGAGACMGFALRAPHVCVHMGVGARMGVALRKQRPRRLNESEAEPVEQKESCIRLIHATFLQVYQCLPPRASPSGVIRRYFARRPWGRYRQTFPPCPPRRRCILNAENDCRGKTLLLVLGLTAKCHKGTRLGM